MLKNVIPKVLLTLLLTGVYTGCTPEKHALATFDWNDYKQRFVMGDGRIIDTGNQNISHSEGQGYGLLLALGANDKVSFQQIWGWTRKNLQIREDHLFMWRRQPDTPLAHEDKNNATDGDILIAWALLKAYERWQIAEYKATALAIVEDIKAKLVRQWQGQPILLAGEYGFTKDGQYTINLSHWIFPAFDSFSEYDDPVLWGELNESGEMLLEKARYGRWGLPPDWLLLAVDLSFAPGKEPLFGYNAVRIPLYLVWGKRSNRENLAPFLAFWGAYPSFIPAWTNLKDNCIDSYPASQGVESINALARQSLGEIDTYFSTPDDPKADYYSASLSLLSQLVAHGSI